MQNLKGINVCVFFWPLSCSAVSEMTPGRPLINLITAKSNLGRAAQLNHGRASTGT